MNPLENKMESFKKNLTNNENNQDYLKCKRDLNYIYDQKIEGVKIRKNVIGMKMAKNLQIFFLTWKKIKPFKTKYIY